VSEGPSRDAGRVLAGLAAGSRVAGYLLEEQVGAGGMAVVFRARDERLRRVVALKVLGPGPAADEDFRRRFLGESRAAARVDDPHIIPVHEAGEAGGVLFIAMRYVPGGDLRGLLLRAGPQTPSRVAGIVSPVASALDAAHAAGLVHRDVKPANVLLDVAPGRAEHVYLSDFGLSKGVLPQGMTGSGNWVGTPGYSAPEQIRGRPVDGRADQYALACVTFELLCDTAVFPRDEVVAALYAHVSEPPPRLTGRRPGTPDAADAVFVRALAKEPDDRYASCGDFADALREAFGLPRYADRPGRQEPAHPPARTTDPATITAAAARPGTRTAAGRKPAVARRAVLGLAVTAAAGLALAGWELSRGTGTGTIPPASGTLLWNAPIPAGIGWGPVVAGDVVCVGNASTTRELYALRARSGHLAWSRQGGAGPDISGPGSGTTVAGKTIYTLIVVSDDINPANSVAAYDVGTGTRSWKLPLPLLVPGSGPVVAGQVVYLAVDGVLYALDRDNGRQLWTFSAFTGSQWLAVGGDTVYLANGSDSAGGLYAVRSGRMIWHLPSYGGLAASPVADGDLVYVVTNSGGTYALRAADGREVWNFRPGTVTAGGPDYAAATGAVPGPLLAGGRVYVGDGQGAVHALRAADGREIWHSPVPGQGFDLAIGRETVYLGSEDGVIRALRASDGGQIWHFATGGSYASVTGAGSTVYVGGNNLYALRAADGRQQWSFPIRAMSLTTAPGAVYVSTGSSLYAMLA
jgi:outer membrane protein assembly factor BamB